MVINPALLALTLPLHPPPSQDDDFMAGSFTTLSTKPALRTPSRMLLRIMFADLWPVALGLQLLLKRQLISSWRCMEEPLKIWREATCLQTMFLLSVPCKNHLARRNYPWSSGKHHGKISGAHRHMNSCTLHPAPQICIWHLVGLAEHHDRKNICIIKTYEKVLRAVQLLGKTIPLTTEQGRQAAAASNTGGLLSWHFSI